MTNKNLFKYAAPSDFCFLWPALKMMLTNFHCHETTIFFKAFSEKN
jgi:hypothetical protein